jgi:hypothetical protein
MFGSFNFDQNIHEQNDGVSQGYSLGVPQGGNISGSPAGEQHQFVYSRKEARSVRHLHN